MRCTAGHESTALDYCDVCGIAMVGQPAAADPAPAPVPAAASSDCPSCGTANAPDALFCEACGYDFTTGQLPSPLSPPDDPPSPSPTPSPPADLTGAVGPVDHVAPGLNGWVAEVWVDPDWYADQESTDPLPSPGLPLVVRLRNTSVLVGRASRSRNITPDIDLSSDTGISRRHAQLTTDGSRWWVEDLGSSNGTYVGAVGSGLPRTPVDQGQKREVGPDDRIYLGAWSRIIVRKATPDEF